MGKRKGDFYGVRKGRKPGVYHSWPESKEQVEGFSNFAVKRFLTYEEAKRYVEEFGTTVASSITDDYNNKETDVSDRDRRYYFEDLKGSSSTNKCEDIDAQRFWKRKATDHDKVSQASSPPKRFCSSASTNLDSKSIFEEVDAYMKVTNLKNGEAKWKLCFPDYVKGAKEHCSRGGLEPSTLRAGVKAILRAIESHPDPTAQLHIFTNEENSIQCIKNKENNCVLVEKDLIKKCQEKMLDCQYQPILTYVKSEKETEWGDYEPFLSDDEDLTQMIINKGKGKEKQL